MQKSKYHFEKLTPNDDLDLNVYEEALNFIFANPDVKNVAISGAYSAGKSSVLATYKKKYNKLKYIHISLAHFKPQNYEGEKNVSESILEGKIINQLIHQIPSNKIPQTNFKVKGTVSTNKAILLTLIIVFFLTLIFYFINFDEWCSYVNNLADNSLKILLSLTINDCALILNSIIFMGFLYWFIYNLIVTLLNKNILKRFNLYGSEIEIFEESDESYFDKYLNEVLYLFENSNADIIIFEDVDRFGSNQIFERLREVNTLANIKLEEKSGKSIRIFHRRKKDTKKVIRFFYLLRDDMFISKDRTKFFDYIIPIVPIVDSSNSYDQLIGILKKGNIVSLFNANFLQGISLYVDDMRLLKNIYNEFIVYYQRLNITELDSNKMFAMIVYKNLFPCDFSDLQLNKGFVYSLFRNKNNFIKKEIEVLNTCIKDKRTMIKNAEQEHLVSDRELYLVFIDKYLSSYVNNPYSKNNSDLSELLERYLRNSEKEELSLRKQTLDNKLNGRCDTLHNEISELENELEKMKNKKLHQIINKDNADEIFRINITNEIGENINFNDVKCNEYFDLLKYLIRNGYIDETYPDYMTYFYENSLNRIDKIFLRSVTDENPKEYTYKLHNPALVVSRLKLTDFDKVETLNFDLLTYLLHTRTNNDYIEKIFENIKYTNNLDFAYHYFKITSEMPGFIKRLNSIWPNIFKLFLEKKIMSDKELHEYSIYSIRHTEGKGLVAINIDNCLCDYISNHANYFSTSIADVSNLIQGLRLLNVKFRNVSEQRINEDVINLIYRNSLYEINDENLKVITVLAYDINDESKIEHMNYTLLNTNPTSEITEYANANINKYLEANLKICNGLIKDTENTVITLLNNPDISLELKKTYISVLRTNLSSIKEINDTSLWELMLESGVIRYSETNILDSFNELSLSNNVINFINKGKKDLDYSKVSYDEEIKEKLFDNIVACNELDNTKYKQILTTLNYSYENFNVKDISNEKVIILIKEKVIHMTRNNLSFLRENYAEYTIEFIENNIETYINIMNDALFMQEELLEILDLAIDDKLKIELIDFSKEEISIIGKNYSSEVCLYILNNFMDKFDLNKLISSFDKWDDIVQIKILDLAAKNISQIINDVTDFSEQFIFRILDSDTLLWDDKICLLAKAIRNLAKERLVEILAKMNLNEYIKIFDSKSKSKIEANEENERLLNAFKENSYILDFTLDPKKEGFYKIIKNKS